MQKPLKKPFPKLLILKTILIFLLFYFISLIFWLQVKDTYGHLITLVGSKFVAGLKDSKLEMITQEKDIIKITFRYLKYTNFLVDISVKTSNYTFNVPLTLAIMAGLYPFIKRRKRAYAETALILIIVHFLYVFSREAKLLTEIYMNRGIEGLSVPRLFVYQLLSGFISNMVIRFEPFLIGFYIFIRFRR